MKYHKYEYEETDKLCKLLITFSFDKFNKENQDKIFNDVINVVYKLELISALSNNDIMNINKFLKLAKHSNGLCIKYFMKKEV